ncbi:MAG: hypothetical protein O3B84_04280 [Chloroflexi bacterium]|nr:hypothetical protein [Chloroflexota bacterium]
MRMEQYFVGSGRHRGASGLAVVLLARPPLPFSPAQCREFGHEEEYPVMHDDYEPGEESIFEHLRDHPPDWIRGGEREVGWREGMSVAAAQAVAALGESFHSCPYTEPMAGLTPQAVWELAIVSAAGRLGLQIFEDDLDLDDDDDED